MGIRIMQANQQNSLHLYKKIYRHANPQKSLHIFTAYASQQAGYEEYSRQTAEYYIHL